MKVRFTHTRVVDDLSKGTPDERRFEDGQVYDLPEPSARRWIARNVAVLVKEEEPAPQGAKPPDPADASQQATPNAPGDQATRSPAMDTKAAAASIAQMVTEWVDGGIRGGTDWRPGLAGTIELRLNRFAQATIDAGHQVAADAPDGKTAPAEAAASKQIGTDAPGDQASPEAPVDTGRQAATDAPEGQTGTADASASKEATTDAPGKPSSDAPADAGQQASDAPGGQSAPAGASGSEAAPPAGAKAAAAADKNGKPGKGGKGKA